MSRALRRFDLRDHAAQLLDLAVDIAHGIQMHVVEPLYASDRDAQACAVRETLRQDLALERRQLAPGVVEAIGSPAGVSCPECGGPLWEVGDGDAKVYRCHIGHAQSTKVLLRSQDVELERALWIAVRTLEERAHLLRRLAREHRERGHASMTGSFEERAEEARHEADKARKHLVEIVQRTKATG